MTDTDKLAEALRELVRVCDEHDAMMTSILGRPADWNADYLKVAKEALAAHAAEAAQPAAQAEPVGCLSIWRFRGSGAMVNHDFDYYGQLPDGSYMLYTHPPAQPKDARDAWQPIETLSDAPDLVLAYVPPDEQFPTGRMMIWRRDVLARNIAGPRPEHLMFPATHWMPLPKPPAMAREDDRDL